MWVFEKRFLFNIEHTRTRILIAWLIPILLTLAATFYIVIDEKKQEGFVWYIVALALSKIACMGLLFCRQMNTHAVDWIQRSED